jgi:DNA topoisomerase I
LQRESEKYLYIELGIAFASWMSSRMHQAKPTPTELHHELVVEARQAGLRYTSDDYPGIRRKRQGHGFAYIDDKKKPLKDEATLKRIRSLVIPPAWKDVWICSLENGHLQATGRDARNRKQYRYHPRWREQRDETKFEHMLDFAKLLPRIRHQVKRDLRLPGMPRAKVLATIVRLLETTLIRVGNDEYARENHSYGLTTMHNRHVQVRKSEITFSFRGKSGKDHEISLEDPNLAKIIRKCQEMPGQELFSYLEEGATHSIGSHDVNEYLHAIAGSEFTAKDFRTWIGTVLAATAFREVEAVTNPTQGKKNVSLVIESVAKMLGNTPTVCRKCYIHPEVIGSYLDGETLDIIRQRISKKLTTSSRSLRPMEAAVLALLQRRLKSVHKKTPVTRLLQKSIKARRKKSRGANSA